MKFASLGKALIIATLLFVYNHPANAKVDIQELKEMARPYVEKFLGVEKSDELLGKAPETILLPEIPEIKTDSKAFEEKEVKEIDPKNRPTLEEQAKFDFHYINELYEATKGARASDEEVANWMNVLQQGGSREGVYRGLVLDSSYTGLENFEAANSDKIIKYSMQFFEKYINASVQEEVLKEMNFYSLKRILVEKTLEVADAFGDTPELYDWYAVMSAEMAENHKDVFKEKLRLATGRKVHRDWARKVPEQYLKSEIIIKMHRVLNSLQ